jgi:hypothetical protein
LLHLGCGSLGAVGAMGWGTGLHLRPTKLSYRTQGMKSKSQ